MAKKGSSGKGSSEPKDTESKINEPEIPKVESEQIRRHRANIRAAFDLFLADDEDRIIQEEVGTVIRYLGQFPTEKTIVEEILPTMQSDDPDAYVTFEKFEPRMLELLLANEHPAEGQAVLWSAFRALDEEKCGYVEVEYIKSLFTQMGTPFRPKELEPFLALAQDPETGRIYYEDYIMAYAKQVDANNKRLQTMEPSEAKTSG